MNVGGRTGECKINCLNTTGVPILLSVHSLSQMGAIIDFSKGAAFFGHLSDQDFVPLERESYGPRAGVGPGTITPVWEKDEDGVELARLESSSERHDA